MKSIVTVLILVAFLAAPAYALPARPDVPVLVPVARDSSGYLVNVAPLGKFHENTYRTYRDLGPYPRTLVVQKEPETNRGSVYAFRERRYLVQSPVTIRNPYLDSGSASILLSTGGTHYLSDSLTGGTRYRIVSPFQLY